MRAVIYARFSSDLQRDASIEDQVRISKALAAREGYTVGRIYADRAMSGSNMIQRPELMELMTDANKGCFDVVLCEGIDRLSRNQRDIADIYQRLEFNRVSVKTVSEGDVSEIHIGLKGTMSALFLKDLKIKVKRGQEGRILAGAASGNLCYGYDLIPGEEAGRWRINPEQAQTVRKIYALYAEGNSPRTIAKLLDDENIPSPRGGVWGQSAINGNRKRASGILENPIYSGQRVYNRQSFLKDPMTGKVVARVNPESEWLRQDVPALAIVTPKMWAKVRERKDRNASRTYRRKTYLISGLIKCGSCGGAYTSHGDGRFSCSHRRDRGTCSNKKRAKVEDIQDRILAAVETHLTDPQYIQLFIQAYREEWEALAAEKSGEAAKVEKQIANCRRKIDSLIQMIESGVTSAAIAEQLQKRENELAELTAKAKTPTKIETLPLPENLAKIWGQEIKGIKHFMTTNVEKAAEMLRDIVETVILTPNGTDFALTIGGSVGRGRGT